MPLICEPGGRGLFLPLFGEWEQGWPNGLRVALYLIGLLWTFLGVAIIADIFMAAIEQITAKTRAVTTTAKDGSTKTYHVQVWNGTVANLTLMALGSSAPEILLSVIEVISNNFYSGELGPSTIVGSAAFNLMVIIAVCVSAIPAGERRTIEQFGVFGVTATSSVFAYLWLVVILMLVSPNIVEWWEGLLAFIFFPVLVTSAYVVDIGLFARKATSSSTKIAGTGSLSEKEVSKLVAEVKARHPHETLPKEVLAELVAHEAGRRVPKSRARWRVHATRQMFGGKRVIQPQESRLDEELPYAGLRASEADADDEEAERKTLRGGVSIVTFTSGGKYSVSEGDDHVTVTVVREGNLQRKVEVKYKTVDGTAKAKEDYIAVSGTLKFDKGERYKTIQIKVVDDDEVEPDEHFFVKLLSAHVPGHVHVPGRSPVVVQLSTAQVTVYDNDIGGVFLFEQETTRTTDSNHQVVVRVLRREGNKGRVWVDFSTSDGKAIDGYDYEAVSDRLYFEDRELVKEITIPIMPTSSYDDREEEFYVHLTNPSPGTLLERGAGGKPQAKVTATVIIVNDSELKQEVDTIRHIMPAINTDKLALGSSQWREQFVEAVTVRGDDPDSPPKLTDWLGHVVTMPWKLLFAICPPTMLLDGVACFFVALCLIGVITGVIGDLAGLLGCTMGMPDAITAITLVALGTSLPDTFASMASAKGEPTADSSIGNVTGSNSVNVFLGLGMPWTIGALFWHFNGVTDEWRHTYPELVHLYPHGGFAVPAGDLGYSVTVFSSCAVFTLLMIVVRRKIWKAELGGPQPWKAITSGLFVCLWVLYIALSARKTLASGNHRHPEG